MSQVDWINSVEDLKFARQNHFDIEVRNVLCDYSRTKLIDLLMEASE